MRLSWKAWWASSSSRSCSVARSAAFSTTSDPSSASCSTSRRSSLLQGRGAVVWLQITRPSGRVLGHERDHDVGLERTVRRPGPAACRRLAARVLDEDRLGVAGGDAPQAEVVRRRPTTCAAQRALEVAVRAHRLQVPDPVLVVAHQQDADAEAAEPALSTVREIIGRKYHGGHGEESGGEPTPMAASARGKSWRWVKITPTHIVTWDNNKLPKGTPG